MKKIGNIFVHDVGRLTSNKQQPTKIYIFLKIIGKITTDFFFFVWYAHSMDHIFGNLIGDFRSKL